MAMKEADIEIVSDGLLSIREVIRFTQLSRSTVYALMEAGQLPYVKLGRARRVPRRALLELAAGNLKGAWRAR